MDPVLLSILCVVSINFLLSVKVFYMLYQKKKKKKKKKKNDFNRKGDLVLSMMKKKGNRQHRYLVVHQ